MMSEPIYILKLGLENVRCFGEKAELDLSDGNGNWRQWTVIVGDNGLGKTTLLQVLAGLESKKDIKIVNPENLSDVIANQFGFRFNEFFYKKYYLSLKKNNQDVNINFQLLKENNIYNGLVGFGNGIMHNTYFDEQIVVFGYGANRFMSFTSLIESKSDNSATLFDDDAKLINAEEWLLNLDYSASKESEIKKFAEERRELVKETLKGLLLAE